MVERERETNKKEFEGSHFSTNHFFKNQNRRFFANSFFQPVSKFFDIVKKLILSNFAVAATDRHSSSASSSLSAKLVVTGSNPVKVGVMHVFPVSCRKLFLGVKN